MLVKVGKFEAVPFVQSQLRENVSYLEGANLIKRTKSVAKK